LSAVPIWLVPLVGSIPDGHQRVPGRRQPLLHLGLELVHRHAGKRGAEYLLQLPQLPSTALGWSESELQNQESEPQGLLPKCQGPRHPGKGGAPKFLAGVENDPGSAHVGSEAKPWQGPVRSSHPERFLAVLHRTPSASFLPLGKWRACRAESREATREIACSEPFQCEPRGKGSQ
jgi:hypothetical protein